jgi:outer membrane protein assembly factor BamA
LADPILAGEATQKESEIPQPNERKVVIETLSFEAATQLPDSILDDLTASVKQHEIRKRNAPISIGELEEEVIREFLQEQGYFTAKVSVQAQLLGSDLPNERYSLSVRIGDIRQFWLGDIQFREADPTVFSPGELRELIPLGDGDVFNIKEIRDGIAALSKFYDSHGYINFTVTTLDIDGDRQRISITLELKGGSQFRVRNIEFLGLDTASDGGWDHGGRQRQPTKPSPGRAVKGSRPGLTHGAGVFGRAGAGQPGVRPREGFHH